MVSARIRKHLPKLLVLFSLCCLSFTYGLVSGRYKVFPYRVIRDARTALLALVQAGQPVENSGLESYKHRVLVPTVTAHTSNIGEELVLVSGGAGYLRQYHPTGCLAWLMDRQGKVLHTWKHDPSIWNKLERVSRVPGVSGNAYPVGIHLFDDGGLLVTYQEVNAFPFAIGLARFDVDSRLLWKKELLTHHWFSVASDGRIFVPSMRVVDSPVPIAGTEASIVSDSGKIYSDLILVLDANGNVLDEISMLDALFASGWEGLLTRPESPFRAASLLTDDPLHLNDAQLVGERFAESQPWLSADDLLVSFRNINAVGILDLSSRRFKWLSAGSTIGQHSPRLCSDGVLVLDNLGGDRELGGTRLVKIGFEHGRPSTVFPRPGVAMPDLCRTLNSGYLDVNRDGNRVLMAVAAEGALWEIDLPSGKVLWEYIYVHPNEDGRRMAINTARYVYRPSFLRNPEQD